MSEMKRLIGVFTVACPACEALLTVEGDGRCACDHCGAVFAHGFGYLRPVQEAERDALDTVVAS